MSEDIGISRQARNNFAVGGLSFSAVVIVLTTWLGTPGNSLHTSAQAWAFAMIAGILAGVGFGAVVEAWKGKP